MYPQAHETQSVSEVQEVHLDGHKEAQTGPKFPGLHVVQVLELTHVVQLKGQLEAHTGPKLRYLQVVQFVDEIHVAHLLGHIVQVLVVEDDLKYPSIQLLQVVPLYPASHALQLVSEEQLMHLKGQAAHVKVAAVVT